MVGDSDHYNFLPRYVRWYVRLQRCKRYLYAGAFIILVLALVSIMVLVRSYYSYQDVQSQWEAIQHNENNQHILSAYDSLHQVIDKALNSKNAYDTQYIAITLLDGAMANPGTVTIQNITFTEDGFSMVGISNNDESYQSYMQYIQGHLPRWVCNGKQDIQQDSGYSVFHLDGHKKEHDSTHTENNM